MEPGRAALRRLDPPGVRRGGGRARAARGPVPQEWPRRLFHPLRGVPRRAGAGRRRLGRGLRHEAVEPRGRAPDEPPPRRVPRERHPARRFRGGALARHARLRPVPRRDADPRRDRLRPVARLAPLRVPHGAGARDRARRPAPADLLQPLDPRGQVSDRLSVLPRRRATLRVRGAPVGRTPRSARSTTTGDEANRSRGSGSSSFPSSPTSRTRPMCAPGSSAGPATGRSSACDGSGDPRGRRS